MTINIYRSGDELGCAAGRLAAQTLISRIADQGGARIIVATGASQFSFLEALTASPGIDWAKVEMFHLDEYVGLPMSHPASFRKYLLERFINPTGIKNFHLLNGEGDVGEVCAGVGAMISRSPVDLAFVGIGENGHLAFNDPPADFKTEKPYLVVNLDENCRRQQVGEGWFKTLEEVPRQAISMSICQIMKAKTILCVVPDLRKAAAVKRCLQGPVCPEAPASILQQHPDVTVFLDEASASMLGERPGLTHAD